PDRRRRGPPDTAHRHHPAVRLLRRLVRGGQPHAAGDAARRLGPRLPVASEDAVNRQIARLFTAFALRFAPLIRFTGYWQIWAEGSLRAHRDNLTEVVHQLSIKRGLILAGDGTVLARNKIRTDRDGRKVYLRVYPTKGLFAHVVGYSSPSANRAGLELEYNDYLTGSSSDLTGTIENAFSSLGGGTAVGDDVITSLDPAIPRIAQRD